VTGARARDCRRKARAVALVAFVALAPLLLVALAGAVPADPAGGATLEASSLALGGVHRLVHAAHAPRLDLAAVARLVPSALDLDLRAPAPSPDGPARVVAEAAPVGAMQNLRF